MVNRMIKYLKIDENSDENSFKKLITKVIE